MPQEFQILRCCDCEKFQVHHVKKAKKWQCKVCGLKQSMKRAFFIGSSRDCRVNVQKLNFQAGEQEMKRKLIESCSSVDDENPSLEISNEDFGFSTENEIDENDWIDKSDGIDFGFSTENEVDENDWIDKNDGIDESDWVDENDWIDGIDENPTENLYNRNLQYDFDDEMPRKKQRCESYSGSKTSEEDNLIHLNKDVENQRGFVFLSILKCQQDENSSKTVNSSNNISSADVPKVEDKQEYDSFKDREENSLTEVAKYRSNSVLKPTHGFQLILNEAKKQRTDFNYDLDL
ncbi:unnamed protein product [Larinioides sclopetarius]|uniref:MRN complex-interacting protein N-terminal domain-containing protein n=1 Tax=Larinioides sclopetarius TaxID=280406 RepID=A0AAV1ZXM4_9ARAC